MSPNLSIAEVLAILKTEIAQRQATVSTLEGLLAGGEHPSAGSPTRGRPRGTNSVAAVTIEILREVGRPMHGIGEIVPALRARGVHIKNNNGLATALLRNRRDCCARRARHLRAQRRGRSTHIHHVGTPPPRRSPEFSRRRERRGGEPGPAERPARRSVQNGR